MTWVWIKQFSQIFYFSSQNYKDMQVHYVYYKEIVIQLW